MSPVLAIATTSLRRFLRDRSNYFFVFVFPMVLVVLVGLQFGDEGTGGRVLVVGTSDLADEVATTLDAEARVTRVGAVADAQATIARGRADAAVVVEVADDAAFDAGEPLDLAVVVGTSNQAAAVRQAVSTELSELGRRRLSEVALVDAGVDPAAATEALAAIGDAGPSVLVSTAGDTDSIGEQFEGLGQFDLGAAQQLSLFVFLASLAGATALIQSRQLGVTRRELAGPVTPGRVIMGEALGRFAVAFVQGGWIVLGTAVLFGVDWGDPWASGLVLVLFCAVSAAAAMVFGALLDNENVAGGVGVGAGLVLAALGGSMLPLELFPDTLATISAITPHHWAYEAYAEITRRGGGVADVLPQLGALALMTAVLLPLGAWLLRRSLARAL